MKTLQNLLESGDFKGLYPERERQKQAARYKKLYSEFSGLFGEKGPYYIFSSPGRVEIGGNHTDHNNGKVIAASVNLDALCFAKKTSDNIVDIYDLKYKERFKIDLNGLTPLEDEKNRFPALIRGTAAGLKKRGYRIGGFQACLHNEVFSGSGLSSSAAIEALLCSIFNEFYNESKVDFITSAAIGQYAENVFFGKPCGLLDQSACAAGGMTAIDFKDPKNPEYQKLGNPFENGEYLMAVVKPGGDHGGLTGLYASIPEEMKKAASFFGKEVCRQISLEELFGKAEELRQKEGDRVFLRAYHFLKENERVDNQIEALRGRDFDKFFALIKASGDSSWKYLQNVYAPSDPRRQELSSALAVADHFTSKYGGACRVHGGGFAGTILAFVKKEKSPEFQDLMEKAFGASCVVSLDIRKDGARLAAKIDE